MAGRAAGSISLEPSVDDVAELALERAERFLAGLAYYDKKIAEGKTPKEALRALKRRISDAIYAYLVADARRPSTPVNAEAISSAMCPRLSGSWCP